MSFLNQLALVLIFGNAIIGSPALSAPSSAELRASETKTTNSVSKTTITELMSQLKSRIEKRDFRWDLSLFHDQDWSSHGSSVNGLPLIYWTCGHPKSPNRSLILSAVHGDEVTPVFFGFRVVEWLKARKEKLCKDNFIVVAPIVNPDGFLRYRRGTRTNYNKVDLNRNFDTPDWEALAHLKWKQRLVNGQPQRRYYPGDKAATEPEIHFQKWLIKKFHPAKIMSVHAPLKFLDFDGPSTERAKIFARDYISAVQMMKSRLQSSTRLLKFHVFGTYPGSLGNYAGRINGIPTITTELPSTNPHRAAMYFGELEKSTRVFIEFDLSERAEQRVLSQAKEEDHNQ